MSREYLVGIDLGTSNCAVAFVDPSGGANAPVADFPITQVRHAGDAGPSPLLPSAIYIKGEHELPPEAIALPWDPAPRDLAGEFAREQGARVPGRLVISAKSWLSHSAVDRTAAILPWGAPPDVAKISPVDASARLLRHILQSWDSAHPESPIAKQEVVITVPASFDEIARALTVNAAREAGFDKFTLVEEPQAAFYDFIANHRNDLDTQLEGVKLVLVVDIGGGTSDFTLVETGAAHTLRRIAVGDHLMLGGDNMDAAIARRAEEKMKAEGKLRPSQWSQLVQVSRLAKESLLGERPPQNYHLSVVSEGSRMVGGSLSTQLDAEEIAQIVLDGFFPHCSVDDMPRRATRMALQEFGLPYAQDPAITRQIAAFLRTHGQAGPPDAILLNGGVFNSARIAARLVEVVSSWYSSIERIRVLQHDSLELAVARGAAYYALVRRGMGRRIGGGTAHAFYVGLESKREPKALCVIPRGQEEGRIAEISDRTFNLTLGRPVQFPLFTSTSDRIAASGDIVTIEDDLHPLPPIHTLLKSSENKTGTVPVHLRAVLTEIGTLQLWCVSGVTGEQWRLEFELRGSSASPGETIIESMPPRFSEARTSIEQIFGGQPTPGTPITTDIKRLWRGLEQTLGPREQWRAPVLRELWTALFAGAKRRRKSPDHERIWFQLVGYTLRPGFGYPLDDWRAEQTATLSPGIQAHNDKRVWTEFWIMWRRIAGGLTDTRQQEIWNYLRPHLQRRLGSPSVKNIPKLKGVQPESLDEMVRLAVSLEHLSPEDKAELGDWIAPHAMTHGPWAWALGRVGARVPMYGSAHRAVDPEKAASWLDVLLQAHSQNVEGALFAITQIARLTGDRSRDLDEPLRDRALEILKRAGAPQSWQQLLLHAVQMEEADKARAFGDTLPVGLAA
ncbi:MAG TPA: Hsp70 family protein [Terriglobia bacterium]|jgi:molecular chaperone DnaK (HSP70)